MSTATLTSPAERAAAAAARPSRPLPSFIRPEAAKDDNWQSAEEFFRTIRYVTLKVTNGCNLKCSYCNVDADLPTTPRMSAATVKRVTDLLMQNSTAKEVMIEFHGGEPLLMSEEWFDEVCGYAAEQAKKYGKTVAHPMQTNGTRLTEKRLEHFQKLNVRVGVSCDGPPHINDRHRMGGKGVEKALKMMVERRAHFGMILVLSHSNCADMKEVMEYLHSMGVPGFRVNFMQPQGLGSTHNLLSAQQMFEGMKAVFEHMEATDCAVMEATMQLLVNRFIGGRLANPPLSCWELNCQAGKVYVAVNLAGDVFSCGTDMMNHRLGHIDLGFSRPNVKSTLCGLHNKDPWYIRCFGCAARRICAQSCSTSDHNNKAYRDYECDYTRLLFQYFMENEGRVRKVHQAIARRFPGGNMMR